MPRGAPGRSEGGSRAPKSRVDTLEGDEISCVRVSCCWFEFSDSSFQVAFSRCSVSGFRFQILCVADLAPAIADLNSLGSAFGS